MPVIGNTPRDQEIAKYAAELDAQFPPGYDQSKPPKFVDFGADYIRYMEAHPTLDPYLVYQTVVARIELLVSIPSGIGKAIGTAAGATAGIGQAGATATASIVPTWLQGFSWLRIAELIIGVVLGAVALDKLLDGKAGVATTIAKVVK